MSGTPWCEDDYVCFVLLCMSKQLTGKRNRDFEKHKTKIITVSSCFRTHLNFVIKARQLLKPAHANLCSTLQKRITGPLVESKQTLKIKNSSSLTLD